MELSVKFNFLLLIVLLSACQDENQESLLEFPITSEQINFQTLGSTPTEVLTNLRAAQTVNDFDLYRSKNGRYPIKRQLDFNVTLFIEKILTHNNTIYTEFRYFSIGDSILYGRIDSIRDNDKTYYRNEVFHQGDGFIQNYVSQYNWFYGVNRKPRDFLKKVSTDYHYIRIACGYAAKNYGEIEKALYHAAFDNNQAYIEELLTSINPEEQTLGIIGMRYLQDCGVEISPKTKHLMDYLIERNTPIKACITCSGGIWELKKYLKAYSWESIPNVVL